MELAQALLRLWKRRVWLAIGIVFAIVAGVASTVAMKSTTYAAASTQMVVDAPRSALGNLQTSLVPFTNRAIVFARLMTSPQALQYIGQAAGIPGNEIAAEGPSEIGAPTATHTPTAVKDGHLIAPTTKYVLRFDQNPELPTVDIYSQAPTANEAIALANGAVTGFSKYLDSLDVQTAVPDGQRVQIRQLGGAQGGVVDPGSSKSIAALVGMFVLIAWCVGILWVSRLRANLRAAKSGTPIPGATSREPANISDDDFDQEMSGLLAGAAETPVPPAPSRSRQVASYGSFADDLLEQRMTSEHAAHER
jgi:hypothetical protein